MRDLWHNTSGVTQVLHSTGFHPVEVPPGGVVVADGLEPPPWKTGYFEPAPTLREYLRRNPGAGVVLHRSYALGDVLMLLAVVNRLQREHPAATFAIRTLEAYAGAIPRVNVDRADYAISLDGVLERDHDPLAPESRMPRTHIYLRALGYSGGVEPEDWHNPVMSGPLPVPDGAPEGGYVAVQWAGSGPVKSLGQDRMRALVRELSARWTVVVFHGERVEDVGGGTDLTGRGLGHRGLFGLVAGARALVCFDSAPLWVAHFTRTPTVLLCGPTDPEVRLAEHPLAPEGAAAVELDEMVGCEHCAEHAEACGWRYRCMAETPVRRVAEAVGKALEKLTEV